MAKAQEIKQRIEIEDPQVWLAEVLRIRFKEVLSFRDAALDPEQIEGVHDMRVAIRRLRSVIRDFGEITEKLPLKKLRKRMKDLADTLGKVRDVDVFREAIKDISPNADQVVVKEGIDRLFTELALKRSEMHTELLKALSDEAAQELESRFANSLSEAVKQRALFQVDSVHHAAKVIVEKSIKEFRKHGDAIYFPLSSQRLHRLRIAGKHFRYAMELFGENLGAWSERVVEEISKFQRHVGDLHDFDVWSVLLRDRARNAKHGEVDRRTAAWLISEFQRGRSKSYRKALAIWTNWETCSFWIELAEAIDRPDQV